MENETILDNSRKFDLYEKTIDKMSGEQILKLAALGVGGVLSFTTILCLSGYDFKMGNFGMVLKKHDNLQLKRVA